jgi:hypothetical protein
VAHDVAGEIEDERVFLALEKPHSAPGHLDIKAGRSGRAKHGDQIDAGRVESCRQHVAVRQALDLPFLELPQQPVAFGGGRLARHHLRRHAVRAQDVAHLSRVIDADAEREP